MKPVKIKRSEDNKLHIEWNVGKSFDIDFLYLRDECPCVNCQGETVLFSTYIPIKAPFKPAGFYEIEKIDKIGNYAIQIFWKDGHNTGIYSWEKLKEICDKSDLKNKKADEK